jgi:hypothetical protein
VVSKHHPVYDVLSITTLENHRKKTCIKVKTLLNVSDSSIITSTELKVKWGM